MADLALLAVELGTSDRTLRRAAGRGTLRSIRASERRITVSPEEADYARRHWPVLSSLIAELRTVPDVRLAVVFGSLARGDFQEQSDVDLLVRFARGGFVRRARLAERLGQAAGRTVQLVELGDAVASPLLLADALAGGRVLVDRDGDWPKLKRRERTIRRRAAEAEAQLLDDVWNGLPELGVVE